MSRFAKRLASMLIPLSLCLLLVGCSENEVDHSSDLEGAWCLVASTNTGESNIEFDTLHDKNNEANFENNQSGTITINGQTKAFRITDSNQSCKIASEDGETVFYAKIVQGSEKTRDTLVLTSGFDSNKRIVAIRYDKNIPDKPVSIWLNFSDATSSTSSGGSGSRYTHKKDGAYVYDEYRDSTPSSNDSNSSHPTTTGKKNALETAKRYLSTMPFSEKRLKEQLEYEGFSSNEADYAVANCGADWNQQAANKAKDYLDTMSFSRSRLIEQLEYEGFTKSQAEYGASQTGY